MSAAVLCRGPLFECLNCGHSASLELRLENNPHKQGESAPSGPAEGDRIRCEACKQQHLIVPDGVVMIRTSW